MAAATNQHAPQHKDLLFELVDRCRRGSASAWSEMYRSHERLVFSVARRMRLSDSEVADVGQAVWLRLYEHIEEIRDPGAVRSWLVTTARREALAVIRKQRRTAPLTFDVASIHESAPDECLVDREARAAMNRAWERLRPDDQLILDTLVLNGQVDYDRAATVLCRPIGSLGPTRQRALRRLRQLFDQELLTAGRSRTSRHN